jgi:3D (Asp-Asp-Asp) domain-containing protein
MMKLMSIIKKTLTNKIGYFAFGFMSLPGLFGGGMSNSVAQTTPAGNLDLLAAVSYMNPVSGQDESEKKIAFQDGIFILSSSNHNQTVSSESKDVQVKTIAKSAKTLKNSKSIADLKVVGTKKVTMTAYSSTPDQTDDSPFITANGEHVYDGGVACNFLPFGAKVRFPDYFGDKVFTVNDRMAKRFSDRIDVWMETRSDALQFGRRTLAVEILE